MRTTSTGIRIGCAYQRRHTPTADELRVQQALLGAKRRKGLLRRAAAAASLCYELALIATVVAICVAVSVR